MPRSMPLSLNCQAPSMATSVLLRIDGGPMGKFSVPGVPPTCALARQFPASAPRQRRARTVRRDRPVKLRTVGEFVDDAAVVVAEAQGVAGIGEAIAKRPNYIRHT